MGAAFDESASEEEAQMKIVDEIHYEPNFKPNPAVYSLPSKPGQLTALAMAMRRVQLRLDIHRILKAARHRRQAEVAALTFNSRYGTFAAAP